MDYPTIIIEQRQQTPQVLITPGGQLFQLLENQGLLLLIPLESYDHPLQPQDQNPSSRPPDDGSLQYRQGRGEPGTLVLPPEVQPGMLDMQSEGGDLEISTTD